MAALSCRWKATLRWEAADGRVLEVTRETTVSLEEMSLGSFRAARQAATETEIPRTHMPLIPHCAIRRLPVWVTVISIYFVVPFAGKVQKGSVEERIISLAAAKVGLRTSFSAAADIVLETGPTAAVLFVAAALLR